MKAFSSKEVAFSIETGNRTDFSNTDITGDVVIHLSSSRNINLKNAVIRGSLTLDTSDYIDIDFKGATFLGTVVINFLRGRIDLKGATFTCGLNIKASDQYFLDLSETRLAGEVDISDSKFSSIDLSYIDFTQKEESDKFIFKYNDIRGKVNASNSKFHNAIFNGTKFKREANFNDSWFSYSTNPSNGNFSDCVFEGEASFNKANFDKAAFFNRTKFLDLAHLTTLNKETKSDGSFSGGHF